MADNQAGSAPEDGPTPRGTQDDNTIRRADYPPRVTNRDRTAQQGKERQDVILGSIVLLVGAVLLIWFLVSVATGEDEPGGGGTDEGPGDESAGAYIACEDFVEDLLKAPSTADFSGYFGSSVSQTGNRYTVRGTVDAENSFGAAIRSNFTCTVRYVEPTDDFDLVSLTGIN